MQLQPRPNAISMPNKTREFKFVHSTTCWLDHGFLPLTHGSMTSIYVYVRKNRKMEYIFSERKKILSNFPRHKCLIAICEWNVSSYSKYLHNWLDKAIEHSQTLNDFQTKHFCNCISKVSQPGPTMNIMFAQYCTSTLHTMMTTTIYLHKRCGTIFAMKILLLFTSNGESFS